MPRARKINPESYSTPVPVETPSSDASSPSVLPEAKPVSPAQPAQPAALPEEPTFAPRKRLPSHQVWPDAIPQMKADFITEYIVNGGVLKAAADSIGVTTQTIRNWKKADPAFAADFEAAQADANDTIRREIVRRAVEGWDEAVYQNGRFVGYVHKYSDNLLMFHAKSRMLEYRDRVDITSNDQHIAQAMTIVDAVQDDQASELAAQLVERLAAQRTLPTATTTSTNDDSDE